MAETKGGRASSHCWDLGLAMNVTHCGRNQTRSGQQPRLRAGTGYVTYCGREQIRSGQRSLPGAEIGYDVTDCGRKQRRAGQLSLLGSGTGYTSTDCGCDEETAVKTSCQYLELGHNQLWQRRKANKPVITAFGCGSGDNVASCGSDDITSCQLSLPGAFGLAIM